MILEEGLRPSKTPYGHLRPVPPRLPSEILDLVPLEIMSIKVRNRWSWTRQDSRVCRGSEF